MPGREADVGFDASNSVLADVHARVIHGFLLDRQATGAGSPLVILELGAHSPQFGYRLIRALATRCRQFPMPMETPFLYVMAGDEQAVARWQNNSRLSGLVARGLLDFARLGVVADRGPVGPIVLEHLGVDLVAGFHAAAVVAIANGVFGRAPCERFVVEGGRAHRAGDPESPEHAGDMSGYDRDEWNQLIAGYAEQLDRGTFTISSCALDWLERIRQMSSAWMVLCVDHGFIHERNLAQPSTVPGIAPVNFHALSEVSRAAGGAVLAPAEPGTTLMLVAFFGSDGADTPFETVRGYHEAMEEFTRQMDWRALEPVLLRSLSRANVEELCAFVRASKWDEEALLACMPHFLSRLQTDELSAGARVSIRRAVEGVWSCYVPEQEYPPVRVEVTGDVSDADIPPRSDIAFGIGTGCSRLSSISAPRCCSSSRCGSTDRAPPHISTPPCVQPSVGSVNERLVSWTRRWRSSLVLSRPVICACG